MSKSNEKQVFKDLKETKKLRFRESSEVSDLANSKLKTVEKLFLPNKQVLNVTSTAKIIFAFSKLQLLHFSLTKTCFCKFKKHSKTLSLPKSSQSQLVRKYSLKMILKGSVSTEQKALWKWKVFKDFQKQTQFKLKKAFKFLEKQQLNNFFSKWTQKNLQTTQCKLLKLAFGKAEFRYHWLKKLCFQSLSHGAFVSVLESHSKTLCKRKKPTVRSRKSNKVNSLVCYLHQISLCKHKLPQTALFTWKSRTLNYLKNKNKNITKQHCYTLLKKLLYKLPKIAFHRWQLAVSSSKIFIFQANKKLKTIDRTPRTPRTLASSYLGSPKPSVFDRLYQNLGSKADTCLSVGTTPQKSLISPMSSMLAEKSYKKNCWKGCQTSIFSLQNSVSSFKLDLAGIKPTSPKVKSERSYKVFNSKIAKKHLVVMNKLLKKP